MDFIMHIIDVQMLDKTMVKQTFGIEIPHWNDSHRFCLARMSEY